MKTVGLQLELVGTIVASISNSFNGFVISGDGHTISISGLTRQETNQVKKFNGRVVTVRVDSITVDEHHGRAGPKRA